MKKPLVIITGPTAAGKTAISLSLAKRISGEIISADSMQVYKGLDIGSAKISPDEMQGVTHHLIDICEPTYDYNVACFTKEGKKALDKIYSNNNLPIIVGGTGFYIQALIKDLDFQSEDESNDIRSYYEKLANEKGALYLHDLLKETDPGSAESIHPNNIKRVIRALEFYKKTGKLMSLNNEEQSAKDSPYNFAYFVLTKDREKLYADIDKRVDIMIKSGLVDEVKSLIDLGINKTHTAMQGLGYKEIYDYITGETSLDEAIYPIKRDTRHFAKRQITWFKREKECIWINKSDYNSEDDILSFMIKTLKEKDIFK